MRLRDQLHALRDAARSLGASVNTQDCLKLIRVSQPYGRLFFNELLDPKWLPYLEQHGFYSDLPKSQILDGGATMHSPHYPLQGLVRLAKKAPKEVTDLLYHLPLNDNPMIREQVLRVAAQIIDSSVIDRLLPVLKDVVKLHSNSNWIWLDDILANWLNVGANIQSLELLRTSFVSALQQNSAFSAPVNEWRTEEIDRKILAKLARAEPLRTADLVFSLLLIWAEKKRVEMTEESGYVRSDKVGDYDYPPIFWIEDFGQESVYGSDFERILANRLFHIGEGLLRGSHLDVFKEFDEMLRGDRWYAFQRIRWELYAKFPEVTLPFARQDILQRIPSLSFWAYGHCREIARMIEAHAEAHGKEFLSNTEIEAYVQNVLTGPIFEHTGEFSVERKKGFHAGQLYPIRKLLPPEFAEKYSSLEDGSWGISPPRSVRSGFIREVAPPRASAMSEMSDAELWSFLDNWNPSAKMRFEDDFHEESVGALAEKFIALVEAFPQRFAYSTRWWMNLRRPSILQAHIQKATEQLNEKHDESTNRHVIPSSEQWQVWFALVSRVIELTSVGFENGQTENAPTPTDSNWARIVVVKFLVATIRSPYRPPLELYRQIGSQLQRLLEDRAGWFEDTEKPWNGDWLTVAINSVHGTALEALLELALSQKKDELLGKPDAWIFHSIATQIQKPDAPPALFAICGARLRLLVYLYKSEIKSHAQFFLPRENAAQMDALVYSHFGYDNPMRDILEALPDLPDCALECLKRSANMCPKTPSSHFDFGGRLGTHLGFYYWNGFFSNQKAADATLDSYFAHAQAQSRAAMISQIGNIFEKVDKDASNAEIFKRAIRLWERRYSSIELLIASGQFAHGEYDGELGAFLGWYGAKCFPLDWKYKHTLKAIEALVKVPEVYSLVETLKQQTHEGNGLLESIVILRQLVNKATNELRWSYRDKTFRELLATALASSNPTVVHLAESVQEALLLEGYFEFLDILQPNLTRESILDQSAE